MRLLDSLRSGEGRGPKIGGIYRHYKTKGFYLVLAVCQNTGDAHPEPPPYMMVVYYSFSALSVFTRPLSEFVAWVEREGTNVKQPRFALIDDMVLEPRR